MFAEHNKGARSFCPTTHQPAGLQPQICPTGAARWVSVPKSYPSKGGSFAVAPPASGAQLCPGFAFCPSISSGTAGCFCAGKGGPVPDRWRLEPPAWGQPVSAPRSAWLALLRAKIKPFIFSGALTAQTPTLQGGDQSPAPFDPIPVISPPAFRD